MMKSLLLGFLLTGLVKASPPAEEVYKVVEAAGLPRAIVNLQFSDSFPDVAIIGVENQLKAVYLDNKYNSLNQATGTMVTRMDAQQASAWVTQVMLAFETPLFSRPNEFIGKSDWQQPTAQEDGAKGFKVKLWVREKTGELTLRQYHLTPHGVRLSILQRIKL